MNTTEAIEFLRGELSRARLLSFQPLEVCLVPPTYESLTEGPAPFEPEEAHDFIDSWDIEEETARWQARRDKCSALTMAIGALNAMNELPGTVDIEFTYEPPDSAAEVVADLVTRIQKRSYPLGPAATPEEEL